MILILVSYFFSWGKTMKIWQLFSFFVLSLTSLCFYITIHAFFFYLVCGDCFLYFCFQSMFLHLYLLFLLLLLSRAFEILAFETNQCICMYKVTHIAGLTVEFVWNLFVWYSWKKSEDIFKKQKNPWLTNMYL